MTLAEKLARGVLDAMNAGDIAAVGPLVAADFVDHGAPPWAPQGRAGYLRILAYVTEALKIRYEVHDVVAAGDKVAIRATAHGVNEVDMLGFTPTGKPYAMHTMHLYRESGGLLVEHWGIRDEIGVLWQVGALPRPKPAGFGLPAVPSAAVPSAAVPSAAAPSAAVPSAAVPSAAVPSAARLEG